MCSLLLFGNVAGNSGRVCHNRHPSTLVVGVPDHEVAFLILLLLFGDHLVALVPLSEEDVKDPRVGEAHPALIHELLPEAILASLVPAESDVLNNKPHQTLRTKHYLIKQDRLTHLPIVPLPLDGLPPIRLARVLVNLVPVFHRDHMALDVEDALGWLPLWLGVVPCLGNPGNVL